MPNPEPGGDARSDALEAYGGPRRRARWSVGAAIVVILVALGVTVVSAMASSGGEPAELVAVDAPDGEGGGSTSATVFVHVSGEVREPGLYRLGDAARVVDAIAAASGFTEEADRGGVNLARPVTDGEQLIVPGIGDAANAGGATVDGTVRLNSATIDELETLPRIGPEMARRIISWRDENGPFVAVEDLLAVPGIGEKTLEALRDAVRL
ncbi:ComEA family DNA-binding protein [Microbacterium sp. LRZ72]|uniref:ComEA family DNA-binding protein n=1 Tax=Microbacterium sp. LRZ72 TaxID=2942481 RepID=UPI0029B476E4|nr:ComEA family DNA-binding protein [Microbacterium sp. LRZ72]MDX2375473.1 ComEA family DNA-binding protein [Microbacterium sp. LRZ72]